LTVLSLLPELELEINSGEVPRQELNDLIVIPVRVCDFEVSLSHSIVYALTAKLTVEAFKLVELIRLKVVEEAIGRVERDGEEGVLALLRQELKGL
jgi:hypothetical protein